MSGSSSSAGKRVKTLTRCGCNRDCTIFNFAVGGDWGGREISIELERLGLPKRAQKVRGIATKTAPRGKSFQLFAAGGVSVLYPEPCTSWKRRLRELYAEGFRFVQFKLVPSSGGSK